MVNLFGARNRGNTSTDMNSIPCSPSTTCKCCATRRPSTGPFAIAGGDRHHVEEETGCEAIFGYGHIPRETARTI